MRTILTLLILIFSFAFAEGQIPAKPECDCQAIIKKDSLAFYYKKKKSSSNTIFVRKKITNGGVLKGKIIDKNTNLPLSYTAIELIQDSDLVITGCSDENGEFTLKPIEAGKYKMRSNACDFQILEINGLVIVAGKTVYQDMALLPIVKKKEN